MLSRMLITKIFSFFAMLVVSTYSFSVDFPNRPINLIVGFKAGGGTDTFARAFSKVAPKYMNGQPLVVVNKPGGGGIIGGRFVAGQPPTGYSLYLASAGSLMLRNLVKKQVVSNDDFRLVGTIGKLSGGIFVPASSPIKSLPELIDKLKKTNQTLRWGHSGRGNVWHVAGLGLMKMNNVIAKDVPFKGGSGVRSALISGQVDFGVLAAHLGLGFEKDLRMLAVLSDDRFQSALGVPTVKELKVDYTQVFSPMVVMTPKRTDDKTYKKLINIVQRVANDPEYIELMKTTGMPALALDADETKTLLDNALIEWEPLLGKDK